MIQFHPFVPFFFKTQFFFFFRNDGLYRLTTLVISSVQIILRFLYDFLDAFFTLFSHFHAKSERSLLRLRKMLSVTRSSFHREEISLLRRILGKYVHGISDCSKIAFFNKHYATYDTT